MNEEQKAPWQKLANSDSKLYAAQKPAVAKPKPSVTKAKSSKAKPKSVAVKAKAKPKVKAAKGKVASVALKTRKSAKTVKVTMFYLGRRVVRGGYKHALIDLSHKTAFMFNC